MMRHIPVIAQTGTGSTGLSAYDDALWRAGLGNANLIALSSVIPPGWHPHPLGKLHFAPRWGNRLYVVQAMCRDGEPGAGLAAGIGWAILERDGGGVFVEHDAIGENEQQALSRVRQQIAQSLTELCERRDVRQRSDGNGVEVGQVTIATTARPASAACALVVAVLKEEPW